MKTEQTLRLGIDLVELQRFAVRLQARGFRDKVFTHAEQVLCDRAAWPPLRYAELFAIKEAFMKALGAGIGQGVWFTQIEVAERGSGEPRLTGEAARLFTDRGVHVTRCTVSYAGDYVTALVLIQG